MEASSSAVRALTSPGVRALGGAGTRPVPPGGVREEPVLEVGHGVGRSTRPRKCAVRAARRSQATAGGGCSGGGGSGGESPGAGRTAYEGSAVSPWAGVLDGGGRGEPEGQERAEPTRSVAAVAAEPTGWGGGWGHGAPSVGTRVAGARAGAGTARADPCPGRGTASGPTVAGDGSGWLSTRAAGAAAGGGGRRTIVVSGSGAPAGVAAVDAVGGRCDGSVGECLGRGPRLVTAVALAMTVPGRPASRGLERSRPTGGLPLVGRVVAAGGAARGAGGAASARRGAGGGWCTGLGPPGGWAMDGHPLGGEGSTALAGGRPGGGGPATTDGRGMSCLTVNNGGQGVDTDATIVVSGSGRVSARLLCGAGADGAAGGTLGAGGTWGTLPGAECWGAGPTRGKR